MPKGGQGVKKACKNAYVINGVKMSILDCIGCGFYLVVMTSCLKVESPYLTSHCMHWKPSDMAITKSSNSTGLVSTIRYHITI